MKTLWMTRAFPSLVAGCVAMALLGACSRPQDRAEAAAPGVASPNVPGMCEEHGVPEQVCGICHPELLARMHPGEGLEVRLASSSSAAEAGIAVAPADTDRRGDGVECFAEMTYNQNKLAQINPLVGGIITSVEVDLGDRVTRGALLARITSTAIGEAQSAYLEALAEDELRRKAVERQRNLRDEQIASEQDLQEAEAAHRRASAALQETRQHLTVLGFDAERLRALTEPDATPGVLDLRAPFSGEIIERTAVLGAVVETGKPLFTLADTTVLWAMVSIPETQLERVRTGQKVELTMDSLPGKVFTGTLTWLSSGIDERTRLARGRAEVRNTEELLKARMFAHARILTTASADALVVPESAVQNVGGTAILFVKSADDLYEARAVELGAKRFGRVEIVAGLHPADEVVVSGAFALKSQLLISRLGAGCVDE